MKKIISLILAILMIATFVPLTFAGATETIYLENTNIYYDLDGTTATFHCTDENGIMTDYEWYTNASESPNGKNNTSPFWETTNIKKVIFEEGVTHISAVIFRGCPVEEVVLPATLKSVGWLAFCGCSIKSLILPEGVESLAMEAFYWNPCTELYVPSTLKRADYESLCFPVDSTMTNLTINVDPANVETAIPYQPEDRIVKDDFAHWFCCTGFAENATLTLAKQTVDNLQFNLGATGTVYLEHGSKVNVVDEDALNTIVEENLQGFYKMVFWDTYNREGFEQAWRMYLRNVDVEKPIVTKLITKDNASAIFGGATVIFTYDHIFEAKNTIPATCTTAGSVEKVCLCGETITTTIKATGHSDVIAEFNRVNPTCSTVGGYDNYYVCATCHRNEFIEHITIEKLDCTAGEWEIVKEATEDEEGLKVKKCTECGEIVVNETIEKLPKTEPETKEETTTEAETTHHHDDTDYGDICLICGNDHHGNLIQDFICLIVSVCRKIAAFFNGGTWGPGARFPLPVE